MNGFDIETIVCVVYIKQVYINIPAAAARGSLSELAASGVTCAACGHVCMENALCTHRPNSVANTIHATTKYAAVAHQSRDARWSP